LVNSVRGIVLVGGGGSLDLDDFEEDEEVSHTERRTRATIAVENLGRAVAGDEGAFAALLPELIKGSGRLLEFGHGLARGSEDPSVTWNKLVTQVAATEKPNVLMLCGFLNGLQDRDKAAVQALLDEAVVDATLGRWLPRLQSSVMIDEQGVKRLRRALNIGKAPVSEFFTLVYGGACEPISGPAFRDLMLSVSAKPDGNAVALEILSMRLHSDGTAKRKPLPETIEAGRELLAQHRFERRSSQADRDDYKLGVAAKACLGGPEGAPITQKL